jgi:hypothetical protein
MFVRQKMLVRQKRIGRYTYVYLVETVREDGQIKQRIIRNLGRREDVERRGRLYVLRTNIRLHPLNVMLRYRELLVVEQLFRSEKALLATRPIYHQTEAAIWGHVFCSFLAVVLRKELEERLADARLKPEWRELLADLDRLQEIEVEPDGKQFIVRRPLTGVAGKAFQAVGVALPPNIRNADPASVA